MGGKQTLNVGQASQTALKETASPALRNLSLQARMRRHLRRRMIEDMTIRNLSRSTQQSHLYAVAKFSRHFGRAPSLLGMEEVRAYQLHLIERKYLWTHINQVACALRYRLALVDGTARDRFRGAK